MHNVYNKYKYIQYMYNNDNCLREKSDGTKTKQLTNLPQTGDLFNSNSTII